MQLNAMVLHNNIGNSQMDNAMHSKASFENKPIEFIFPCGDFMTVFPHGLSAALSQNEVGMNNLFWGFRKFL